MNASTYDVDGPDPTAGYRAVDHADSVRGNRGWWDADADRYVAEHRAFLGDAELVWGPEGLRESAAGLLGDVAGLDVLEVGCGAAQGARWAAAAGARVVGVDLSAGMLAQARRLDDDARRLDDDARRLNDDAPRLDDDARRLDDDAPQLRDGARTGPAAAGFHGYVQADACALPFAEGVFDLAFSAYGAVPFVADSALLMREVARVLRPGGRWVFSVSHPIRWAFPDAPGPEGLTVHRSYFDRTPYVECGGEVVTYAEHHRTLGDRVRELVSAEFTLVDFVEPEWPEGLETAWGGWSPLRGRLIPGTAILAARKPPGPPVTRARG